MSSPKEKRSPVIRFLEAFLQEENIKWILGLGVCILLGSSIRLVTMHWHECTPVWKYLILTAYTGAIYLLGQLSYHRLGLRKTGTVLMALTVLLIPLSFLALHWIRPQGETEVFDWLRSSGLTLAMMANLVWTLFAARKIFQHFLRQTQPTFLVCYLTLCVAGAIVPGLPIAWAPVLSLALWAVFAAGTVKVNRHTFWLTEEHRLPRIFGFFPIGLLGAQFAVVFLLGLANHVTTAWLGLLLTLIALPVLFTADTVARVFEQRTGGLVRPIPWSIIGPLSLGTLFCAAGVVLALSNWPASGMIVPTAILAAVSMAVVGRRTQKSAFVWGMILCVMIAYQTAPVFFKESLLQLRNQTASAINEPRLPYAFYGLTYAPFVLVFSVLAKVLQRRNQTLFANPIRLTASVLPWILFAASLTHPKAILPVSLVLCPLFLGQTYLFQERYILIPAAMAFLAAAFGLPTFCQEVLEQPLSLDAALIVWTVAAGLMLAPGFLIDRWSRTLPWSRRVESISAGTTSIFQVFSLLATLVGTLFCFAHLSLAWTVLFSPHQIPSLILLALLTAHTLRWLVPGLGEVTLVFGTLVALHLAQPSFLSSTEFVVVLLVGQWVISYVLERIPQSRIARAFLQPSIHVSFTGLSVIFAMCLRSWFMAHFGVDRVSVVTSLIALTWALDASRRSVNSFVAGIAWSSMFVFATALATTNMGLQSASEWWMVIWVAVGFGLLFLRQTLLATRKTAVPPSTNHLNEPAGIIETWLSPLSVILPSVFLLTAGLSLAFLGWPFRYAALMAIIGLAISQRLKLCPDITVSMLPLANWQILATIPTAMIGTSTLITSLTLQDLQLIGLPLAASAAISLWAFQSERLRSWVNDTELQKLHETILLMASTLVLIGAFSWSDYGHWNAVNLIWAAVACVSIVGAILSSAIRTQSGDRIWATLAAGFATLIYFTFTGLWSLTDPVIPYLCVFTGISLWFVGRISATSARYSIVKLPFTFTGYWLPLMVVPFTFWRIGFGPESPFAGANSLAMLTAATFYFWRGLTRRHVGTSFLSLVILNVALGLLWRELDWSDPQLFLMPIGVSVLALTELLNREIPSQHHDKLRRIGSLVILVSPTFHIVTGSWLHILTLMIASVCVCLLAIGLRVRTLLYTGTAFLLADLVALVARGAIDQPNVLWIVGVVIGGAVLTLGAVCENHRETVLSRLRGMSAALETWN